MLRFVVQGVVRSKAYTPFSRASCSRLTGKKMAAHIVANTSDDQEYIYLSLAHSLGIPYHPLSSRWEVKEVSSPGYEACFSMWSGCSVSLSNGSESEASIGRRLGPIF
jgi:hypothetical protein